ncbi:hypothetical protein MU582_19785 [Nocardioidaceae bacterium SCSIO 66511]|nr:hypothetical protein MU582_19785 [Nocardioidaceae bacterium SCSIO 66511]
MPRHVSSPAMLSWWQRIAIGLPVLLLAGVVAVALTSDDRGSTSRSEVDTAGAAVSMPPVPAVDAKAETTPRQVGGGAAPAPTRTGVETDDGADDSTGRNNDQAEQDDKSGNGDPGPKTDGGDGGSDEQHNTDTGGNGDDNNNDASNNGGDGDNDDKSDGPEQNDPVTTDPNTVDLDEALAACRSALGSGNVDASVLQTCANALIGTPVEQLQANVASFVDSLGCLLPYLCRN